jgi:hypothetical protein
MTYASLHHASNLAPDHLPPRQRLYETAAALHRHGITNPRLPTMIG